MERVVPLAAKSANRRPRRIHPCKWHASRLPVRSSCTPLRLDSALPLVELSHRMPRVAGPSVSRSSVGTPAAVPATDRQRQQQFVTPVHAYHSAGACNADGIAPHPPAVGVPNADGKSCCAVLNGIQCLASLHSGWFSRGDPPNRVWVGVRRRLALGLGIRRLENSIGIVIYSRLEKKESQ